MAFSLDTLILPMKTEDNAFRAGIARATMLVQGLVDVIGKTVTESVSLASDLSETVSKVNVVFDEQADAILRWGETASTALGMSKNTALSAAATFGNLFKAMEIGSLDATHMSASLVELAADLASFNNMDPTEVLDKLRAGVVGEVEPLRSLGVNLNQALIEQKALELGLWDGVDALDAATKAQAAYAIIMEQTSLAQGDFERTSGGLANQQRIMAAQWEDLKTKLGMVFLPVVTEATTKINEFLSALMDPDMSFETFMEKADTAAARLIKGLGDSINNWVASDGPQQLADSLIGWLDTIGDSEAARSKTQIAMQHLVSAMGNALASVDWGEVWLAIDGALDRLDPIVTQAIDDAFIAGDIALNNAFILMDQAIVAGLNNIDASFNNWVAGQLSIFQNWAAGQVTTINNWGASAVSAMQTALANLGTSIENKLRDIAKTFFNRAEGWGNQMVMGFRSQFAGIIAVVTELRDAINNVLRRIITSFTFSFQLPGWMGGGSNMGTTGGNAVPRASGGAVIANQLYSVAEFFQPERFKPAVNGRVDPIDDEPMVVQFDEDRLAQTFARVLGAELQRVGGRW